MLATLKQTAELVDFFRVNGVKQSYKKNDYIIRPGESPHGVYYIYEGLVKAYDITKYGEENLLIIRKQDEIFPLIWAVTLEDHQIIYQALAPTVTYKVEQEDFTKFIKNNLDAIMPLLDMTMEMYRLHGDRILTLEYRSVRERIISFLINMSERFGKPENDGSIVLEVTLRHQDIASSVNATRETTSRELSALEKKGLIENKNSFIHLKDLSALKKYLV
ncbi:MAG TPA: Crp/Fnr family transcriptional regulator [Candidatus Sulfotelmatobacter sp.]|nr:Crp/Fnr family transcriptional regulator [Candidatus Sulfotelmatobacter sp.]